MVALDAGAHVGAAEALAATARTTMSASAHSANAR
jgi:hypothetical protein